MASWTPGELERHPSLATAQPSEEFVALLQLQLRPPPPTTPELPPLHELEVPDAWVDSGDREAQFWREARSCGVFELEIAMAAAMLRKLLVQNKYLQVSAQPPRFTKWPSRDRHQLWATLWLGMRFVCDREYSASEVERIISAHLATPEPSLVVAVRADLLRRRMLVRPGDGAGAGDDAVNDAEADTDTDIDADHAAAADVEALAAAVEGSGVGGDDAPFAMSRATVEFVLDGDKLFCIRAAVASRRPWWALPLAAQWVAAPRGAQPVASRRFRCVLLEPEDDDARPFAGAAAKFVPVGGAPAIVASACVVAEGEHRFAALEGQIDAPALCLEVQVSNTADGGAARLPPLRVDCCPDEAAADGEWQMVHCVPMPTSEEICNAGRGAVRCFLPGAVPVAEAPEAVSMRKPIAELLETEGGVSVLKGWPRKQKQQAHASLWLAHFLLPERLYRDEEMDWLVATRFTRKSVPDCPQIRKELERCGLVERLAGGGGFRLLEQGRAAAVEALPK